MTILRVVDLPDAPLAAAQKYYGEWQARAEDRTQDDLVLIFAPADHTHRAWRLAAVEGLARVAVPFRVNAIASESESAIAAALVYLAVAPGLTGQYLTLDDAGAGPVVS